MRRAGPVARGALLAGMMSLALASDLVVLALLLAAAEGLLLASGQARRQRVVLWAAAGAAPFAIVAGLLVGQETVGALGPLVVRAEGLALGAGMAGRIVLAVMGAQWLLGTAAPRDVLRLLGRWPRLALAVTGTMRFAPLAAEDWARIREAQAMRGHVLAPGRKGAAGLAPLLVPLFVGTVRRGRLLQEAVEASAFGSGPRTRHPAPRPGLHGLGMAAAGLALLALVALRALGGGA